MRTENDAPKVAVYGIAVAGALSVAAAGALYATLEFDVTAWEWWSWLFAYFAATGTLPVEVLVIGGGLIAGAVIAIVACPWSLDNRAYGDAAWATARDLAKMNPKVMERRGIVLGRFGGFGPFGGRTLMSDAPLSGLVVAPAGTGKTAGVIVPSLLRSDGASLVVNDPKGELFEITAGYRSTLGPVRRVEWSAGAGGSVCWNPIDVANLPDDGVGRGDVIERLVTLLVEGNDDNFFVASGRLALAAWLLFHIYDCEARGEYPSLSTALHGLSNAGQSKEAEAQDDIADKQAFDLELSADRAETEGWPRRITSGLRQLAQLDYRTRSNVLATVFAALRLFLNDNVAETTARSDFTLKDLRGVGGKVVTVYLVVPAFDQDSFGKLTALFVESATRHLTLTRPEPGERPVRFLLDEVGFLPRVKAISMGPAITRGYGVSFLFACQDYAQIRDKWGPGGLDNIISNAAYKIVLTQNNVETAKRISDTVGQKTRLRETSSRSSGLALGRSSKSVSEGYEGAPLIRAEEIMSLKFGRQIVIVQNHASRPIYCRSGYYLRDRTCRRRARIPAPPATPRRP